MLESFPCRPIVRLLPGLGPGLALGLALGLAAPTAAQKTIEELHLTFTLPELQDLEETLRPGKQLRARWTGKVGESEVRIDLLSFPVKEWRFREAGGVTNTIVDFLRENGDFDVDETSFLRGNYGYSPVLSVAGGRIVRDSELVGYQDVAGGLTETHGYALHVQAFPALEGAARKALDTFFEKGIDYGGPKRDPDWTLDEIRERWLADVPEPFHADFLRNLSKKAWHKNAYIRTKHYVIMTNSSGGRAFAKQMEKNYKEIASIFPFEDVEGRRLMPVFLFRDEEDYVEFYANIAKISKEQADRSKGHAWRDYYATYYEAPGDPVHIHEQTHQIFSNRLALDGGGSWFQEGVAEYVETSENDRNVVANLVEKGRHTPLEEFFQLSSLLHSSAENRVTGGSEAGDNYKQAALFIEFLRESKFGKGKFERFLNTMGRVPRRNLEKIRAVFQEIYEVSIAELDLEFQEYCKKR